MASDKQSIIWSSSINIDHSDDNGLKSNQYQKIMFNMCNYLNLNFLKDKKKLTYLLFITAVTSTVYLLILGYYNNFLLDDYGMIASVEKYGIFGHIKILYLTWQGRFSGFFVIDTIFKIFGYFKNLLILTLIYLFTGYIIYYYFFKWIFFELERKYLIFLSIITVNLSITGVFTFSTFYWVCASGYIFINFLTVLLLYSIFNKNSNYTLSLVAIIINAIIIGGFVETYTPLVILILGVVYLYRFKMQTWNVFWKDRINIKLLVSLIILFVCFIIVILAPGNKIRMEAFSTVHPTGVFLLKKSIRAMINLCFLITSKLGYQLLLFPIWLWVGILLKEKGHMPKSKFYSFNWTTFFISAFVLLLFFFIAIIPGVYATNALPPPRSLSFMSFVLVAFLAFWGIIVGFSLNRNVLTVNLFLFANLFITFLFVVKISEDMPKARYYHSEVQKRQFELLELNKRGFRGAVVVKPIKLELELSANAKIWNFVMNYYKPSKQMKSYYFPYELYSLSTNPEEWRNIALKTYLKLNFDVIGWDMPDKHLNSEDAKRKLIK